MQKNRLFRNFFKFCHQGRVRVPKRNSKLRFIFVQYLLSSTMYYYRMKSIATYEPSQCFTIVAQHDFLIFNNSTPNEKERKSNCMISYDDDYQHNSTIRSTHGPPNMMEKKKKKKKKKTKITYIHIHMKRRGRLPR